MTDKLTEIEARICGALVEKQLTTPEYYPLTLNALVAACNQKTNREPVVAYTEEIVQKAVDDLREKNLVYVFYGSTSRVPKYKHLLPDALELAPPETAVLCVLMLRGAQTLGEVQETLDNLMRRDLPLAARLERLAGQKEARFAQLLTNEIQSTAGAQNLPEKLSASAVEDDLQNIRRIEKLEHETENLRDEINSLREMFDDFKKQFE